MDAQMAGLDELFYAGFLYESLGQGILLPMSDHPANHVAAEDVHDHIEVKVGPLGGAFQLGNVPRPNLIGTCGKQLGFGVMAQLMASPSFFDTAILIAEDPVHGPYGAVILTLIEERGIDLIGSLILESF